MSVIHEPPGYQCPFCKLAGGSDTAHDCQGDIVRRTSGAMAFISPRWWPRNHGHVLVVPVDHYENLYELPARAGHAVHDLVREIAIAVRQTYGCQGVSTRQHNEPAGNQDAWHYHAHVFPRYADDQPMRLRLIRSSSPASSVGLMPTGSGAISTVRGDTTTADRQLPSADGPYSPEMPVPPYVAELRSRIGHALLWLATARTVTVDGHGRVILGRYLGSDTWTIPGGVIDPGEQPADAAVRECYEETGIVAMPEALTSVTVSGLVTHESGDLTRHLDITFRCRATGGEARPADGEFQDVGWHHADALPALPAYELDILTRALRGDSQPVFTFSGITQALANHSTNREK